MKRIFTFVLLAFSISLLLSCNSEESKIKKAAISFFSAMNHRNMVSAKLYATKESASFLDLMQEQLRETNDTTAPSDERFFVSDIKINGDNATANIRSESQTTPLHVTLKKVGNDWKVAFDKNSIMGMMTELGSDQPKSGQPTVLPNESQNNNPSAPSSSEPVRRDTQVLQLPQ